MSYDPFITKHLNRIKIIQALTGSKRLFVECFPTDEGAKHYPNSNFAVKEIIIEDIPTPAPQELKDWIENEAQESWANHSHYNMDDFCDGFNAGATAATTKLQSQLEEKEDEIESKAILLNACKSANEIMFKEIERLKELIKGEFFNTGHSQIIDQDQWNQFKIDNQL